MNMNIDKERLGELYNFLCNGKGGIIERNKKRYLSASFNYQSSPLFIKDDPVHIHDMAVVRRLLGKEIKLAQTPKKIHPIQPDGCGRKIICKPLSWKKLMDFYQEIDC